MSTSNETELNVLLCTVPDGTLAATTQPCHDPNDARAFPTALGIQALAKWMDKNGFADCYEYYDINNLRPTDDDIRKHFAEVQPTVVGLSAPLSHCYPNVKRIAAILRAMFPDVWIVVGGHVTASSKVILSKTEVDICVVGDGEIAWLNLLNYFKSHERGTPLDTDLLKSYSGVALYDDAGHFQLNGYGEQVPADVLTFVDFDLMKAGLYDRPDLITRFFPPSKQNLSVIGALIDRESPYYREGNTYDPDFGGRVANLPTSKGCVAKCTFCQRYTKGYRVYDLDLLEDYILDLKEKYKVDYFQITDENFGSNRKQAFQIAEIFKKCGVYWEAVGVRCTSFNYEQLKFLRDNNLIYIKFGIESGSQTILDIMEKKFSRENVVEAIRNCTKLKIQTSPDALMLGMPGESSKTVIESANLIGYLRYIIDLDNKIGGAFWATAFPGTPLYEYSQQIGIVGTSIDEEEQWLYRLSEAKTHLYNYCNQTGEDIKTIFFWNELFMLEGKRAYLDHLLQDDIGALAKIRRIYRSCIKPEIDDYVYHIAALHSKASPEYVGKNMSLLRKVVSHGAAVVRFALSLANLALPRSVIYPVFKMFSDIKFNHIKKRHAATVGKLNLFQEQRKPNEKLLVSPARLQGKERQQERSLRYIVKENRALFSAGSGDEEQQRLLLASGQ